MPILLQKRFFGGFETELEISLDFENFVKRCHQTLSRSLAVRTYLEWDNAHDEEI